MDYPMLLQNLDYIINLVVINLCESVLFENVYILRDIILILSTVLSVRCLYIPKKFHSAYQDTFSWK